MRFATLAALALLVAATGAHARSAAVVERWANIVPCPSTGRYEPRCPAHQNDHERPLCAGGADAAHNLARQPIGEARRKDREEWTLCRQMRRQGIARDLSDQAFCALVRAGPYPLIARNYCERRSL